MAVRNIEFNSNSGNITDIKYDDEPQTLAVSFHHGGGGTYFEVPENVANGFETAASAGNYLNTVIKPTFRYERFQG